MTAFVIVQMQIESRGWMKEYFEKIPAVVDRHEGYFIVRGGNPARLEGSQKLPDVAFIVEFPDRDHANRFWSSDEFQKLAVLRRSGSTLNAILVDKLSQPRRPLCVHDECLFGFGSTCSPLRQMPVKASPRMSFGPKRKGPGTCRSPSWSP